jgi:hypothetical protein
MGQIIKNDPCRLLLVEGKDELYFFAALCDELGITDKVQIEEFQGKENLRIFLLNLVNDEDFENLIYVGIIRDADYGGDPFRSVCDAIAASNTRHPHNKLPVPDNELIPAGDELKVNAMILPGDGLEGMLEDLILNAYSRDTAMTCVDQYFSCLKEQKVEMITNRLPKARMRVFLVSKIVSIPKSKTDNWLADIYHRKWWSWDKSAFAEVKAFLRQLTGDE